MKPDLRHLLHKPGGILILFLLFVFGGSGPFPHPSIGSRAMAATVVNSKPVSFAFPAGGADKVLSKPVSVVFPASGTDKVLSKPVSVVFPTSCMSKLVSVAFRTDGDCGEITIAKVQGAINMYLGLKAVDTCVDTDGSGGVSIAEVQRMINLYLGL